MAARNIEAYDKAVELVNDINNAVEENSDCYFDSSASWACAKVAVKEIIDVLTHPIDGRKYPACKFWEEVLEELNQF